MLTGVGYRVLSPLSVACNSLAKMILLSFISTLMYEKTRSLLYGFKEEADLFVFEKLISVSGIGPKSALAMLSVHSPSSLAQMQ
jgi:Holliday junction DNA helicase RuvA